MEAEVSGLTSCIPISHWSFALTLFSIIKRSTIHAQDIYEKILTHTGFIFESNPCRRLRMSYTAKDVLHWRTPVQIHGLMKSTSRCAQHEGNKAVELECTACPESYHRPPVAAE